jgi:hypothetical protein
VPTLAHRVILGAGARLRDLSSQQIVEEILNSVPVPGGDPTAKAWAEKVPAKTARS